MKHMSKSNQRSVNSINELTFNNHSTSYNFNILKCYNIFKISDYWYISMWKVSDNNVITMDFASITDNFIYV